MSDGTATLQDTSGVVRDRAIAEANELRQINFELAQALRVAHAQILLRRRERKTLNLIEQALKHAGTRL